jgi:hypothetical protein
MVAAIAESLQNSSPLSQFILLTVPPAPRKDKVRGIITTAASEWPKIEDDPQDAVKFENITSTCNSRKRFGFSGSFYSVKLRQKQFQAE